MQHEAPARRPRAAWPRSPRPPSALAHPLGNFTVNRHTTIELSGGRIYVQYALDLAEIPTFQLGKQRSSRRLRARGGAEARAPDRRPERTAAPARAPRRRCDQARAASRRSASTPSTSPRRTGSRLTFRDRNFGSRIGWKEVVVRAEDGAELRAASVPAASTSDGLRAYPKDLLRSPLDVTTATAAFSLGRGTGHAAVARPGAARPQHRGGGFESLISRGDLSLGVILLSLAIAAFWGAAHALTPGPRQGDRRRLPRRHEGPADRRRPARRDRDVTHTIGVFALGFVTLLLSRSSSPRRCIPG